MIELIVWIFQQLFGSQEPPARVGPRGGSGRASQDRFGQDAGNQRPKTLAELLEEARSELDGGRARPSAPPPPPPQPIRPPAPVQTPQAARAPATRPAPQDQPQIRVVKAPTAARRTAEQKSARTRKAPKPAAAQPAAAPVVQAKRVQSGVSSWLTAMHSDRLQLKHQAAIIGVIGGVILGPPKCRQPHQSIARGAQPNRVRPL